MAAIEGVLTADGITAAFTPTVSPSEVKVYGFTGSGSINLIEYSSTAKAYDHGTVRGAFSLVTTDTGNTYKLQAHGVYGNVNYYMGP